MRVFDLWYMVFRLEDESVLWMDGMLVIVCDGLIDQIVCKEGKGRWLGVFDIA